jgi:predicted nucleic acid-binding protein
MGALVLDSSVVVAFSRPEDALHAAATEVLTAARTAGDDFILPASVLAEALVGPHRISDEVGSSTAQVLTQLFGLPRTPDLPVVVMSARLRARHHSLRLPDALVIATAMTDGARTLTYDRRLGAVDPSVRVLSP